MISFVSMFDPAFALTDLSGVAGAMVAPPGDASPPAKSSARVVDRFSRSEGTLQSAVSQARARHASQSSSHADTHPMHRAPAAGVTFEPPVDAPFDDLALYKVPTFVDEGGGSWMHPACVSRYVLLAALADRTEMPHQDAGCLEAHAMGVLYNGTVHLWHQNEHGAMDVQTLGTHVASRDEQAHPDQNIVWADERWALYDPSKGTCVQVAAPAADSLYAALLQGYTGRPATSQDIARCRKTLAALMRSESNRDSFAAKALHETQRRLGAFAAANPTEVRRLDAEVQAFEPCPPPSFLGGNEVWPHPTCAAAHDLRRVLARSMRQMGRWGSELSAEAVAHAMGWRVHMWKVPRKDEEAGLFRDVGSIYERVRVFGPQAGAPKHVLNTRNMHYAQFVPVSNDCNKPESKTVLSEGSVVDCGGGGNCLYLAILGPGSTAGDVAWLRTKMVAYIDEHRDIYEAKASDAVDVLWSEFVADQPGRAAMIARRAELYCERHLRASRGAANDPACISSRRHHATDSVGGKYV